MAGVGKVITLMKANIEVTIEEGVGLAPKDRSGTSDPYGIISVVRKGKSVKESECSI